MLSWDLTPPTVLECVVPGFDRWLFAQPTPRIFCFDRYKLLRICTGFLTPSWCIVTTLVFMCRTEKFSLEQTVTEKLHNHRRTFVASFSPISCDWLHCYVKKKIRSISLFRLIFFVLILFKSNEILKKFHPKKTNKIWFRLHFSALPVQWISLFFSLLSLLQQTKPRAVVYEMHTHGTSHTRAHTSEGQKGFVFLVSDVNALSPWAIWKVLQYWASLFSWHSGTRGALGLWAENQSLSPINLQLG